MSENKQTQHSLTSPFQETSPQNNLVAGVDQVISDDFQWTIDALLSQTPTINDSTQETEVEESSATIVGDCLNISHPTLTGRVLISWKTLTGSYQNHWLPTLQGLTIRSGDRVLLSKAANWDEYIVTGVIDGFAKRLEPPRNITAMLNLMRDESICVNGVDGTKLIEIFQSDEGPVVRILHANTNIELPGKLSVSAAQIELRAVQGPVHVEASDDVTIKGELVKLN